MTAATGFQSWIGYVNEGAVDWSADTFAIFLTNTAPNAATNTVLADITEVDYTNLSSRTLVLDSWDQLAALKQQKEESQENDDSVAELVCQKAGGGNKPPTEALLGSTE